MGFGREYPTDQGELFCMTVLGLKLARQFGEHWVEVEAPGVRIGLHPGGTTLTETSRSMSIGLGVEDLSAAMKTLSERGVKFGRVHGSERRIADFADPDGNPLYLIEMDWG